MFGLICLIITTTPVSPQGYSPWSNCQRGGPQFTTTFMSSNLAVLISEGCFLFDFASLPLEVARPIQSTLCTKVVVKRQSIIIIMFSTVMLQKNGQENMQEDRRPTPRDIQKLYIMFMSDRFFHSYNTYYQHRFNHIYFSYEYMNIINKLMKI